MTLTTGPAAAKALTDTVLTHKIAQALATAKQLQNEADTATAALRAMLTEVARDTVYPGRIIEEGTREFPRLRVAGGNSRKARRFEVVSWPMVFDLKPRSASLTKVSVEAYPINDAGKKLSGRAGNSQCAHGDAVTIHYDLCGAVAFDDKRSDAEILLDAVRRSTKA